MKKERFKYNPFLYITMDKKIDDDSEKKLKLQFTTSDDIWDKVLRYKINTGLKNNNLVVEELIKKALEQNTNKEVSSEDELPDDTLAEINEFREKIPTIEKKQMQPFLMIHDKKSDTFYTECHISGENFIKFSDPNSTIDPELEELSKANRELETDNYYYEQMVNDAKEGRSFSDIIIEYNTNYNESKPLKILGGQHRNQAIVEAVKDKVNINHGIKVYFNLDKEQREDIMRIANTNINIATDLRDRLREDVLKPLLKKFGHETGMLRQGDNFGDKRRYDDEFSPTVRMMRSFIVNFFQGKEFNGEIDNDAHIPYLCKSGKDIDSEYMKYYNKFKTKDKFDDIQLIEAGKMFAKLHDKQFKNAEKIKSSAKREYKIKAYNLAIITSWAFASGALQKYPERLKKLYALPDLCNGDDPLSAIDMAKSKHKLDSESYRGLGTRSDNSERGRLLQLFLDFSKSPKSKITEQMCNASISMFHSNFDRKKAEESTKKAYGV
jgi:predicted CopG family antitoxin